MAMCEICGCIRAASSVRRAFVSSMYSETYISRVSGQGERGVTPPFDRFLLCRTLCLRPT
jgi:hypothetical protein